MFTAALGLLLFVQIAPDEARVACILDRVPAADRPLIFQEMSNGSSSGPAVGRLESHIHWCADRLGWDEQEAAGNARVAGALINRDQASVELVRSGISIAYIESWFANQSDEFQGGRQGDPSAERAIVGSLLAELRGQGVTENVLRENALLIGAYLAALHQFEIVAQERALD